MTRQIGLATLLLVSGVLSSPILAGPVNTPLPCGLADATGRTGYVASASGGIEAIDLMTGHVLWTSNEAQVPLLVADQRLYAQAGTKRNRLRIFVYDLNQRGEVLLESDPVVLPGWVITGEAPGHSFKAGWDLEQGVLVLNWQARAWYRGKEKPTPQLEAAARRQGEGKVRIDLTSGKVQHFPVEPVPVTLGPTVPAKDLEKKAIRWQGPVAGQYKAVIQESHKDQQKLVLLSWDRTGVANAPPRELIHGKQVTLLPTLDERLLCVREVQTSPDQRGANNDRERYAWTLIKLETVEVVGRVTFEPATQAMIVIGPRLFVLQGGPITGSLTQPVESTRMLKAIDLRSGKMLWQHPIASKTVYPPER